MHPYHTIREHIEKTKSESPLAADSICLLGASKGQDIALISQLIEAGLADIGENRVQEAKDKYMILNNKYPNIRWHLIGSLQTNKVKEALAIFDVIHTLDRPKLADSLAKELHPDSSKTFFIQVNTGEEPQKAGISPKDTPDFIEYCRKLGLPVVGLMCVPPVDEPPAPHFALLRKLALDHGLKELSMGMSNDYETAIRMGSSCVRIGRALFGERA